MLLHLQSLDERYYKNIDKKDPINVWGLFYSVDSRLRKDLYE